jgi:hypothetical protein
MAPEQLLLFHHWCIFYNQAPKEKRLQHKPWKYAERTPQRNQNAIRSLDFLLQDSDDPPKTANTPASGKAPLGLGQQEETSTEPVKQTEWWPYHH